mgnify:CR=1 FL=1
MTSAVSICANALLMIGAETINSLTDTSPRARQCANLYPMVRDYVLSTHPWHCCIKRVVLNPDTTAPLFDWLAQFSVPADFLRILSVGEAGAEDPYQIENRKILCDAGQVKLRYVFQNTDEASWTPILVSAVTQAMRQALVYSVTSSASLEQLVAQAIEPILKRARAIDSTDQPAETLGDFRTLNARFGTGYGNWS